MSKKYNILILCALVSAILTACVSNPSTGESKLAKSALYGIGAAATCGIIGAVSASDGHSATRARNAALGCGAIGAGVGAYMDQQEKVLKESLKDSQVEVAREDNQIKLIMPENVTFDTNSYSLSLKAIKDLDDVVPVLVKYVDTNIRVHGHTDNTGNDRINNPLSENRAYAVLTYLTQRGVGKERVTHQGFGSKVPLASNATEDGRRQNRRVEILIDPIGENISQ